VSVAAVYSIFNFVVFATRVVVIVAKTVASLTAALYLTNSTAVPKPEVKTP
jgi:hypothetical protein